MTNSNVIFTQDFFVWHALFKSEELCNTQHSKHTSIKYIVISEFTEAVSV